MTRKFENGCWEGGGAIHHVYPWESHFTKEEEKQKIWSGFRWAKAGAEV